MRGACLSVASSIPLDMAKRAKTGGRQATRCDRCGDPAKGTVWGERLCSRHYQRMRRLRLRTLTAAEWETALWLPAGFVVYLRDEKRCWPGGDAWTVDTLRDGIILDSYALSYGALVRHPHYYGWQHLDEFVYGATP